jgi:glycerol kinase
MADYVAAVDQGTTSTRFMIFDHHGKVGMHQMEHEQIYPRPVGWSTTRWRSGPAPRTSSRAR